MSLKDRFRFDELSNIAEDLVIAELEEQLKARGLLQEQDQDSILDMAAFALNLLRPMYRANLLGRVYAQAFSEENAEEIKSAVSRAIDRINQNPPSLA